MLYSYKGQKPTLLPFRIRLDDGSTRTSLNELSPEELEALGFIGPIEEDTQKIEYVNGEYQIIQLTEEEIAQRTIKKEEENRLQKLKNVDYNRFWEFLINSSVYKKLRSTALQSLTANTLCTELISLFSDAKAGYPNTRIIQHYINAILLNFQFTQEEVEELQNIMNKTNLDVIHTLPNEEYLSSYSYDPETNIIIPPKPFNSWTFNKEISSWEAPVPHPTDGKAYDWNEDILNWI